MYKYYHSNGAIVQEVEVMFFEHNKYADTTNAKRVPKKLHSEILLNIADAKKMHFVSNGMRTGSGLVLKVKVKEGSQC